METDRTGARVRYWRERRGMTRGHFADLVGRSPSWVDKIEKGDRQLDRLSVLDQVAEALNVPLQALVDEDGFQGRAECPDPAEIASLRSALQRCSTADTGPTAEKLDRQVSYAWNAFQASDYTTLGPLLARLLDDAQSLAACSSSSNDSEAAASLLTQAYQIIASTTRKLGYFDLEWIAAERALSTAERSGDMALIGGAEFRLVNALRDNRGAREAVEKARSAADRLSETLASGRPESWSLYGHLLLQGAMAAAIAGSLLDCQDLLGQAQDAAGRLGGDRNDYWTAFGPTNVVIHEVAAMVELREWGPAISVANRIPQGPLLGLPRERRANHLLDVARAYSLGGKRESATWALLEADELAPREIRCRPQARDLIADLIRRNRNRPSPELERLAANARVDA